MGGRDQASHQLTIHLLTHVTQQKAPPPTDGSELAQLQAYMMDFGVTKKLVHFLLHFFFTFVCCCFFLRNGKFFGNERKKLNDIDFINDELDNLFNFVHLIHVRTWFIDDWTNYYLQKFLFHEIPVIIWFMTITFWNWTSVDDFKKSMTDI